MKSLAHYIAKKITYESSNKRSFDIVAYGLEVFLNISFQLILLFVIGYMLNCIAAVMLASLSAIVLRSLTGGTHCTSFYKCTLLSCVVFSIIGILSQTVYLNINFLIIICLIMILLIVAIAPVSSRNWTHSNRIYFKIASSILVLLVLVLHNYIKDDLIVAITLGLAWQVFTITPVGFLTISKIDHFLSIRIRKEVT